MTANPHNRFPLWQYLTQPIGRYEQALVLNPRKFWHKKKVHHIERCWIMAYMPEGKTL